VAVRTILLNFTGVYEAEGFAPEGAEVIDCTSMDGVCCYCDAESLEALRKKVKPLEVNAIHWIDSGDYHYLSLLWLEKLDSPFALVLFDNHSDDQAAAFDDSMLSCGSWVRDARKLPLMKHFLRYGEHGSRHTIEHASEPHNNPMNIPEGLPVYISIDKDVLAPAYAVTDWDQGTMTLDELSEAVRGIADTHRILGADICGELTPSKGAVETDLIINAKTNCFIQELLLNLLSHKEPIKTKI